MERIKEEFESIMPKYLENQATETECLMVLNALSESVEMRAWFNIMAKGFNRFVKRRSKSENGSSEN